MNAIANEINEPYQDLELQVTGMPASELDPTDDSGDALYLVNLISPATSRRTPTDIVVCIDVSGSMGSQASAAGVESSGLSMLDVVKHAVHTIAAVLDPSDRLSVVAWSSDSEVVTELTSMSTPGRTTTNSKVSALHTKGMTDIWDGLKKGLTILDSRDSSVVGGIAANTRNGAVFLLTDGVPNVEPPRGFIPSLVRYRDQHGGKYPGVINTFGFGYNLTSELLSDYAFEGTGTYAFIPDSGFVGTIFVNALANTLATTVESAVIGVMADHDDCVLESLSSADVDGSYGDSMTFRSRTVQNGQSYGCVVRAKASGGSVAGPEAIKANVKYRFAGTSREMTEKVCNAQGSGALGEATEAQKQEIAYEAFRLKAIGAMTAALDNYNRDESAEVNSRAIQDLVALIKGWLQRHQPVPAQNFTGADGDAPAPAVTRIADLLKDLEGQVLEAVSKQEYFDKWGKHFLRSIRCAHQLKQCNNFKDPGVQHYGNKLFTELRDLADDKFSSLPPPKPSQSHSRDYGGYNSRRAASPVAAVSMASFNRSDMVCFHGESRVAMAGGRDKAAEDVRAGDLTASGGMVTCVVKTEIPDGHCELARLPTGLRLTAWHPVKLGGQWRFPAEAGILEDTPCSAVYSFLVERASASGDSAGGGWRYDSEVVVDGIACATLAHGVLGNATLSHPFFGTEAVVDALRGCEGWEEGLVTFRSNAASQAGFLLRDTTSSLVVGINASRALAC